MNVEGITQIDAASKLIENDLWVAGTLVLIFVPQIVGLGFFAKTLVFRMFEVVENNTAAITMVNSEIQKSADLKLKVEAQLRESEQVQMEMVRKMGEIEKNLQAQTSAMKSLVEYFNFVAKKD